MFEPQVLIDDITASLCWLEVTGLTSMTAARALVEVIGVNILHLSLSKEIILFVQKGSRCRRTRL